MCIIENRTMDKGEVERAVESLSEGIKSASEDDHHKVCVRVSEVLGPCDGRLSAPIAARLEADLHSVRSIDRTCAFTMDGRRPTDPLISVCLHASTHTRQRAEILAERSQAFLSLGDLPASRADAEHAVLEDRFWAEGCVTARVDGVGAVLQGIGTSSAVTNRRAPK